MSNSTLATKALTEGAIAASLATVLALIGYYIPPLSMIISLVWFIPIVVVIVRQNLKWGVMALVVTAFLLMILTHPIKGLLLVLQMGLVGLLYGYGFREKWPSGKIILLGGLVVVVSTLLVLALTMLLLGVDLSGWQQEMWEQIDYTVQVYANLGLLDGGLMSEEELRAYMEGLLQLIAMMIPGILIAGSLLTAAVNFLLLRLVLKRLGEKITPLPPFRQWQLPWYMVWGVIAALALLLAGDYYQQPHMRTIGMNILYIYFPVLLIAGLTVLAHFNYHLKVPKWLKIIVAVVMVFNLPLTAILITTVGLFDPLLNYRRIPKKQD